MGFHVGQKVVHVGWPRKKYGPDVYFDIPGQLTVGAVYTIRWVGDQEFAAPDGVQPACRLEEVRRETRPRSKDMRKARFDEPWGQIGFRPLQEDEKGEYTAMEVFRKIARDVTDGVVVQYKDKKKTKRDA